MRAGRPSETARIVCLMRALEHEWFGEASLLKDEYARLFLPAAYRRMLRLLGTGPGRWLARPAAFIYESVVLRSAYMDALLLEHAPRMPVILLGAGFDSRGLRLRVHISHGLHEFDFPATQQHKLELLRSNGIPTDYAHFHQADFATSSIEEILTGAGLKGRPALIIWEGVSMYLPEATVMTVLREAGAVLGPGSILAADFWRSSLGPLPIVGGPIRVVFDLFFSEPLLFGTTPDALKAVVAKQGIRQCETYSIKDLRTRFGRPGGLLPEPMFLARFSY